MSCVALFSLRTTTRSNKYYYYYYYYQSAAFLRLNVWTSERWSLSFLSEKRYSLKIHEFEMACKRTAAAYTLDELLQLKACKTIP